MSRTEDVTYGLGRKLKLIHSNEVGTSCESKKLVGLQHSHDITCDKSKGDNVRQAGPYMLGPVVKKYVPTHTTQCLVRKKGANDYYLMKILILNDDQLQDKFHLQRRTIFHTEYSILSLLKSTPGVIQLHDFFKDCIYDERREESKLKKQKLKRLCMVLECLVPHGHYNAEMIPLILYVREKKKLSETEALVIFHNILQVVESLHQMNIVHNNLKLFNIILNRRTLKVKLINFYSAKLLVSDTQVSYDPRNLPVPYKLCEIWSTGVILYTMLHGHPPINSSGPNSNENDNDALNGLSSKIFNTDHSISNEICISTGTRKLLRNLLCRDAYSRPTASEAVEMVGTLLALQPSHNSFFFDHNSFCDQIVPECPNFAAKDGSPEKHSECWLVVGAPNAGLRKYKIAFSEIDADSPEQEVKKVRFHDEFLDGERDIFSRICPTKPASPTRRSSFSKTNQIKFAMLRLGATSFNNINAFSFNYSCKNPSQMDDST